MSVPLEHLDTAVRSQLAAELPLPGVVYHVPCRTMLVCAAYVIQ